MIRQRSVREPEPARLINHINHTRRIQRPRPKRACLNRYRRANFNHHTPRHDSYPAKIKLPPVLQTLNSALIYGFTVT